jgi:putative transposase
LHSRKGQAHEKKLHLDDRPKLNDAEVLRILRQTLEKHFPLEADGYSCSATTLYEVLIGVAANRSTIEAVCQDLASAPDGETIRNYLNEQLRVEDLPLLERRINSALRANWPKMVRGSRALEVAMDFHDRPYYGKAEQKEALWVRGEAHDGTTRFYRVATAYLIKRGQRVTLAIRFVLPEEATVDIVADLLGLLRRCRLVIGCLYLDKGFSSVAVIEYLKRHNQPSLIACTVRGKAGGTRALCKGKKSYLTDYTFGEGKEKECKARVAVCRVFTTRKRTGRNGERGGWLLFVCIELNWTPKKCRKAYRKRFGIETSYRMGNRLLGWTTSPNAAYRFVLIGLGFILLNVWVHLCWLYTQVARRGGRYLAREIFHQGRFIKFLIRALERIYGCITVITAPSVPLL